MKAPRIFLGVVDHALGALDAIDRQAHQHYECSGVTAALDALLRSPILNM